MENLRLARKAKHLTQEDLGKLVNVQKSAISKYEKGYIQPSHEILIKLSHALDVSTDYLIGNDRNANTVSDKNDFTLIEKDLIKKYRLLDQHGQKAVNSVLDVELERCSKAGAPDNLVEIPYVARSGERGTVTRTQEEIDEILKSLKPDTSGRF